MKIVSVVGSNRTDGNTYILLKEMFQDTSEIETRIIQIAELYIRPCEQCFEVCAEMPYECVIDDDLKNILNEMRLADGIIFASPFYFYVPSKFQPFLERLSCLDYFSLEKHGPDKSPLAGKPCLLIVVSASGSSFNAFQMLHHLQEFALMLRMRPVTTNSWPYIGFSAKSGEMEKGAILKEKEVIEQAKGQLRFLKMAITKEETTQANKE